MSTACVPHSLPSSSAFSSSKILAMFLLSVFSMCMINLCPCACHHFLTNSKLQEHVSPAPTKCPSFYKIVGISSQIIGDKVLYNWTCEPSEAIKDIGSIPQYKSWKSPLTYFISSGKIEWYGCRQPNFVMTGIVGSPGPSLNGYTAPPTYKIICVKIKTKYTLANCTKVPMHGPRVNISFGSSKALVGIETKFMFEYLAHLYNFIVCDVVRYCDIAFTTVLGYPKHLIITPHSSKSNRYWFSCVDNYYMSSGTSMQLKCRKGHPYFDAIDTICKPNCCALDINVVGVPIDFSLLKHLICTDNVLVVNCPKNRLLKGNKTICSSYQPHALFTRSSCRPCDKINYCSNVSCNETHTFCLKCLDVHPENGLPLILTKDGTQCVVAAHILEMKLRRLEHDAFKITCVVAGSQPIKFKWTTNTTTASLQSSKDFAIIQRLQEHAYVKCSAENEFGRQERNVSVDPLVPIRYHGNIFHAAKPNTPLLISCISEGTVDVFEWYQLSNTTTYGLPNTLRYLPIEYDLLDNGDTLPIEYDLLDNGNTLKIISAENMQFDFLCIAKNEFETPKTQHIVIINNLQ